MGVLPYEAYKGQFNGPCSACGDGDTAMRYHNHEIQPKSYTLAELEQLTDEYVAKVAEPDSLVDWRMSDFIAWLKRQEKESGR